MRSEAKGKPGMKPGRIGCAPLLALLLASGCGGNAADGRRIGRLDPLFKGDLPINEAQIIQEALDCVRVRYVPTADFRSEHESIIINRLQARMGEVKVVMEPVTEIPREPNGKFLAVICRLSKEGRNTL